jgi:outer membrane protein OmpA-like peptidoglycan-associated protein
MDLYVSQLDETSLVWQEPTILPFPMNTPDDEIQLKVNPNDMSGYFCSNRINNIGEMDIYSYREMDKLTIEGKIINASTNRPIQDGRIFFKPLEYPDNYFKSEFINGKYKLEIYDDETFIVQIEVKDSIVFEDRFEVHEVTGIETTYVKDFTINLSRPEEPVVTKTKEIKASPENIKISAEKREVTERPMKIDDLGNKYRISDKVIINNIYFDFGTSKLTEESTPVLNELFEVMNRKKDMVVEIGGHTDNVGAKEFNLQLSLERANSVKQWLTSKGIESERIVTKGYGEQFPLASNDDEKEGRELNRRIEVTLIE